MTWRLLFLFGLLATAACDGVEPSALKQVATDPAPTKAQPTTPPAPATPDPAAGPAAPESPWRPLAEDSLHDPRNPALRLLQEPAEALSELPPASEGNHVDWVAALRQGIINPRTNIYPETKIRVIDMDILFTDTAGMPIVRFRHRAHTEWLDCKNSHDKIFVAKKGANDISMFDILQGNYCGQCHGAVSFPLTQCVRCHSVPRDQVQPPGTGSQQS